MDRPSSEYGPVSSVLNDRDQSALVVLTASIMLGISTSTLALRLTQRWPWKNALRREDALLLIATIFEVGVVAAAARAVHTGLGRHIEDLSVPDVSQTKQALSVAYALVFVAEGCGYISSFMFAYHTCIDELFRRVMHGLCGAIGLWSLAGMVLFAVSVDSSVSQPTRSTWVGFGSVSIAISLLQLGAVLWLIVPLQMPFWTKIECVAWLCLLVPPTIATVIVRLVYTPKTTFDGDWSWDDNLVMVLLLVQSNLILIGATSPGLRQSIDKLSSGALVAGSSFHGSLLVWNSHRSFHPSGYGRSSNLTRSFVLRSFRTESVSTGNSESLVRNSTAGIVPKSIELDTTSVDHVEVADPVDYSHHTFYET